MNAQVCVHKGGMGKEGLKREVQNRTSLRVRMGVGDCAHVIDCTWDKIGLSEVKKYGWGMMIVLKGGWGRRGGGYVYVDVSPPPPKNYKFFVCLQIIVVVVVVVVMPKKDNLGHTAPVCTSKDSFVTKFFFNLE